MTAKVIDLFAAFATDSKAEKEGTYTRLPRCGDTEFLIARIPNPAYKRLLSSLYKKHRAVLESKGDEAENKSNEIMAEVLAKTVLLGWKGEMNIKGVMTPYSEKAALVMLGLSDFRDLVTEAASDFSTFLADKDAEDAGN